MGSTAEGDRDSILATSLSATKRALDRPLTAYYILIAATTLLLTIGLMMVLSASSVLSYVTYDSSYAVFLRQLTWLLIALPIAFVASRLPLRTLRFMAWPGIVVATLLVVLVSTPLGVEVNGNTNWLALGPLTLQPSELAKLAVICWSADLWARKERLLHESRHVLLPVVPVSGLITALVVLQGDLGTALVLFAIVLGMLWVVGAPVRLFAAALVLVSGVALALAATNPIRLRRLTNFVDPFQDFDNTGWQAAHGLFALASGGWFGKGIAASQQKWGTLPEAHTDFIFAVLGEELGLVGTLLVLCLFLAVAYAGTRVAARASEPFIRYAAAGIVVWLLAQMTINVGMVLALLPVIGVPLPLVSYGGSSLLPTLVALGLLIGFARREPSAAAALRARRRDRAAVVAASAAGSRRGR